MKKTLSAFLLALLPACSPDEQTTATFYDVVPDAGVDDVMQPDALTPPKPDADLDTPDAGTPEESCVFVELLDDGGFDQDPTTWYEYSTQGFSMVGTCGASGGPCAAGTGMAWMSSMVDYYDLVSHSLYVPAGARKLIVTGYYQVDAGQNENPDPTDGATVMFRNDDGSVEAWVLYISNRTQSPDWTWFVGEQITVTTPGRTTLEVLTTNSGYPTGAANFFFDELSVLAEVCQ